MHERLLRKKHKKWEKQPVEGDEHQWQSRTEYGSAAGVKEGE